MCHDMQGLAKNTDAGDIMQPRAITSGRGGSKATASRVHKFKLGSVRVLGAEVAYRVSLKPAAIHGAIVGEHCSKKP